MEYISAKKVNENYNNEEKTFDLSKDDEGIYSFEGTFDQGIVSINLPQIGILADKDEEVFWKEFDARLDLCKEALMCRHYALVGTSSEISPIHWKYGAISRLSEDEKIDDLLYEGNSTLSLSFVGLYELTKLMKGEKNLIKEELEFAEKVIKHIKEKTLQWRENTNIGFSICETYVEDVQNKFANIDKQKFGTIEGITDKGYYMNSYHIDKGEQIAPEDKIKIERKFQDISNCGNIVCELKENEIEEFISFAYKNILCFSVKESE